MALRPEPYLPPVLGVAPNQLNMPRSAQRRIDLSLGRWTREAIPPKGPVAPPYHLAINRLAGSQQHAWKRVAGLPLAGCSRPTTYLSRPQRVTPNLGSAPG